jgi:acetyl esterase/lipase
VFDYHKAIGALGSNSADTQFYLPVEQYEALRKNYRVSPLYGCSKFPPCYLGVGTRDPLLPESLAMAQALKAAGIDYDLHVIEGAPHGFFQLTPLPAYSEGYERAIAWLDRYLKR